MRNASISPKVARMANLKNAMMNGCVAVAVLNHSKKPVAGMKNGVSTAITQIMRIQSCFFIVTN